MSLVYDVSSEKHPGWPISDFSPRLHFSPTVLYILSNDCSASRHGLSQWILLYIQYVRIYIFIRVLRVESSRNNDGTDTDRQSRGSSSSHAIVTIVWSCLVIGLVTATVAVVYSESSYQNRFCSQTSREKCTVSRASPIGDGPVFTIIVPDNACASTQRSWHCRIAEDRNWSQLPAAIRIRFILA